ncbi:hypothetical protein [Clostridium sp. BJN0013]|uniref:hypothetical protein n=1 Tax=Clostridium sp. BJN0013 TaxID=3236840 RepID=UPI0034C6B9D3
MRNNLFDNDGHISNLCIKKFKERDLDNKELIVVFQHIECCEKCVQYLTESFDDSELMEVPFGFEEEVKNKIVKYKKKNRQFLFYSLRVSIAACISLIFVFSSTLSFMANTKIKTLEIVSPKFTVINSINIELGNFTNKIINMEVFNNENEKR